MIFKPELIKLIRSGQKTQTRRTVSADETECRYQPGKAYALQPGRGKPAIGRITITDVRQEQLGDISFKDVRREGFKTTVEFRDYWTKLHARYDPDLPVWVITFELGDTRDLPRLLAARPGGAGGDYTTIPALSIREPFSEAVTEAEQERMAAAARIRDDERNHAARTVAGGRRLSDRVRQVEEHKRHRRVDVTGEMRAIEERVRRAERSVRTASTISSATQPLRPE